MGWILRGPPLTSELWFSSIKPRPPIPEPIAAPIRVAFSSVTSRPESYHGLNASDNSILNEGIHLALFFARDNVITVKILLLSQQISLA
ncbi:hypothetical protein LNQ03_07150 [Klebsiella pneumoniae subsp. pneumoniae]|nr:hypothetical protein [Klebsiella pneumoniae subsp. pneumoniae]